MVKYGLFDRIVFSLVDESSLISVQLGLSNGNIVDSKNLNGIIIGIENLGYDRDIYFIKVDTGDIYDYEYQYNNDVNSSVNKVTIVVVLEQEIIEVYPSIFCTKCKTLCKYKDIGVCDECEIDSEFKTIIDKEKTVYYPGQKIKDEIYIFGTYYKPFFNLLNSRSWMSIQEIKRKLLEYKNYGILNNRVIEFNRYEMIYSYVELFDKLSKNNIGSFSDINYLVRDKSLGKEFLLGNRELYKIIDGEDSRILNKTQEIIPKSHLKKMDLCSRCIFSDCLMCEYNRYKI